MRIHLAHDHAAYSLITALAEVLPAALRHHTGKSAQILSHGPKEPDPGDDYPPFVLEAVLAMVADQDAGMDSLAVVSGSSPNGVLVAANKVAGARAVRGGVAALREARRGIDANVLVVGPEAPLEAAIEAVSAFADEGFRPDADSVRRVIQVMEFETAGTIEGWQVRYGDAVLDGHRRLVPAEPRAVVYDRQGDPSVLHTVPIKEVSPGLGQVRIAVRTAGLNPFDAKIRSGRIPVPQPAFPAGTGQEFAGTVDAVGADARYHDGTPVAVGDAVLGWTGQQGAARDQLLVDAEQIVRKPPRLEWALAGSLTTVGLTARACLDLLDIGLDDVVLVSAAAGGVGSTYTQLAVARGAVVIGTAGPDNLDYVRSLGALAIPYGAGLTQRVADVLPRPLTAVQDNHGRDTAEAGLELGVPAQRIITIADHTAVQELGLASPGRYRRSPATLAELADLAAHGTLRLPVQTFSLDDPQAAYRRMETGHGRGRIAFDTALRRRPAPSGTAGTSLQTSPSGETP